MALRIKDIRLWNLRYLADKEGGITRLGDRMGKSQGQITHLIGRNPVKSIGSQIANEAEREFGLSEGWMDLPHPTEWKGIRTQSWREAAEKAAEAARSIRDSKGEYTVSEAFSPPEPLSCLPLLGWDEVCKKQAAEELQGKETVMVTVPVSEEAFAVKVRGDSMVSQGGGPSFTPGSIIIVDPAIEASNGAYVVLIEDGDSEPVLRQFQVEGRKTFLKPLNSRYPIHELSPDAIICGVVRQMTMEF